MTWKDKLKIDWDMVPCKVACFLANAFKGACVPFFYVFFTTIGMSEMRAGILAAMMSTSCILASPGWAFIADYTKRRKSVLVILCIGATVTMFSVPWIARFIAPLSHQCNNNSTINAARANLTNNFQFNSSSRNATECDKTVSDGEITLLFHVLLGVTLGASMFYFPLADFFETITMNVSVSNKVDYGTQRFFGGVGYALAGLLTGETSEIFNVQDMSHYSQIFFISSICTALLVPLGCYLIDQADYGEPEHPELGDAPPAMHSESGREEISEWREVLRVLSDLEFIIFIITVFISGMANMVFVNFSLKHVLATFGRGKSESSWVVVCHSIGSVIAFPFISRVIALFRGTTPTIIFCLFTWFIRLLVMSLRIPFEVCVCIQLLNGFGLAILFGSLIQHVFTISPKNVSTTISSIMLIVFFYVSAVAANLGGSVLYNKYGGSSVFLGMAIICAVWIVFMTLRLIYTSSKGRKTEREEDAVIENPNIVVKNQGP